MFIELLHDLRIPLLRIYPKEQEKGIQINICPQKIPKQQTHPQKFIAALFTIVKK